MLSATTPPPCASTGTAATDAIAARSPAPTSSGRAAQPADVDSPAPPAEDGGMAELVRPSDEAAGARSERREVPDAADDAVAPGQLAASSWRQVLRRAGQHVGATRLPLLSAGIAFFAVLSIAPVL